MPSELRDAFRALSRDRAFTVLAVLLFALTIGATGGVLAVVDAVLLRPMGIAHQDRTVVVWQRDDARDTAVVELALGEAETWRQHATVFENLAVFGSVNWQLTVVDGDTRTRVPYAAVSASFFAVAGTPPALGRVFDGSDEAGSRPRAAVISDTFWRQHFGASPSVLGQVIRAQDLSASPDGSPDGALEIVGVMPATFDFPRGARLWLPAAPIIRTVARNHATDVARYLTSLRVFYGLGRLRPGASAAQAEREIDGIIRTPEVSRAAGMPSDAVVTALDDYLVGPAKPVLWLMLAGAALMVLLACGSVAGLHLFRAARQDRALAIQMALGASRGRLVRRSLAESALLAGIGAAAAVAVAWAVTQLLRIAAPLDVPRLETVSVDALPVLAGVMILALLSGLLSGVWPAVFITRVDAGPTLMSGARTAMHPRERLLQRLVVGWQVAIAVIVLTGAGLFLRSVQQLDRTALGFNPAALLAVEVEPAVQDQERWDQFYGELLGRLTGMPPVSSAGAVYLRPLHGPIGNDAIPVLEGQTGLGPDAPWRSNPRANLQTVTPGYFQTLGVRLLAGRDFSAADSAAAPNVVIVSASAAARYWPGRDAVGQPIVVPTQRMPGTREELRWQTVVGVVDDVRYRGLTDPRLDVYLPAAQSTMRVKHLMIRTTVAPGTLAGSVRAIALGLDPGAHIGETVAMSDEVARESAPWRFAMHVLTGFGVLAAALATAGLTGLVSLMVTLRRRELGIRAALGATPRRLRAHVLAEAAWTMAVATMVGVLCALALGRVVMGLLVDITPHDPTSVVGAVALTMLAGIAGCLWPAARAAASDPTEALRE